MTHRNARAIAAFAFVIAVVVERAAAARADGLNVSPVRVLLAANQRTAAVTVTNNQARAETLRVESFAWDQSDEQDRLTPTDELLVVPPIFSVAPYATKVVRLGLRTLAPATRERTYRIFLTEVPPDLGTLSAITISYRFSVPVFLPPTLHAGPKPVWSARRSGGRLVLQVRNDGDAHLRISTVKIYTDASRAKLLREQTLAGYVLAGRDVAFTLDVKNAPAAATLVVSAATGEDVDDIAVVVPVTADVSSAPHP